MIPLKDRNLDYYLALPKGEQVEARYQDLIAMGRLKERVFTPQSSDPVLEGYRRIVHSAVGRLEVLGADVVGGVLVDAQVVRIDQSTAMGIARGRRNHAKALAIRRMPEGYL